MIMPSVHSTIKELEKEIDTIKLLHSLRKLPHETAKREIKRLELQLMEHVNQLPSYERQLYMIRKEFGKEY